MTPLPRRRRPAETFDAWVEDGSSPHAGAFTDLAPTVTALLELEPVDPRPDFVEDLRGRVMAAAHSELVAGAPSPDAGVTSAAAARRATVPRRRRRVVAVIGGLSIVGATATMGVAAQTALPGDTLYPLKRAIEDAQVGLEGRDGVDRGERLLANATGRLDELDELDRAGSLDAAAMSATLRDFVDQANEASTLLVDSYRSDGRSATIKELRVFTITSLATIRRLETTLPDPVRSALEEATDALDRIDQLALRLCPSCTDLPALLLGSEAEPASSEQSESPSPAPSGRPGSPVDPAPSTPGPRADGDGRRGPAGPAETPSGPSPDQPDGGTGPSAPPLTGGDGEVTDDADAETRGNGLGGLVGGILGGGSGGGNGGGDGGGGSGGGRGNVSGNGLDDLLPGLGDLTSDLGEGLSGR